MTKLRRLLAPLAGALAAIATASAQVRIEPRPTSHLPIDATNWSDMIAADVDGDGLLDLIAARDGGHFGFQAKARVFLQGPNLTFEEPITVPCEPARHIAAGDIDGDGDLDLLFGGGEYTYATIGGKPSSVARNDGGGLAWSTPTFPVYAQETSGCALADIDGDGDLDALLFQERPTLHFLPVHVWENDGAGNFTDVTTTKVIATPAYTESAAAFDVDGDGDVDIVFQRGWPDGAGLLENDGTGTFTEHTTWATGHYGRLYAAADADGDGDLDLYGDNAVLINDGAGTLSYVGGGNSCHDGQVADLDGDGLLDVCGLEYGTDLPIVWRATSPTSFQNVTSTWLDGDATHAPFPASTPIYNTVCVCAADFEGDGFAEMLIGTTSIFYGSNTVGVPPRLFVNAGGTGFVDANQAPMRSFQKMAWQFGAADIDGDHDTDLLFNGAVLRRNERGNFIEDSAPTGLTFSGTQHSHHADFDGDGDEDVIGVSGIYQASQFGDVEITYGENIGGGTFVDRTTSNMPAGLLVAGSDIASADVDGDGDLDVLIASHSDPLILLLNQGNGVFVDATAQLPPRDDALSAVAFADVDGDGDQDIAAVVGYAELPLTPSGLLYLNDGNGSFTDASDHLPDVTASPLPYFGHITFEDADGDGDVDIAIPGRLLINDGSTNFSLGSAGMFFADFDEDGNLDHLQLTSLVPPTACINTTRVAVVADVDDDGDLDVIYGCRKNYLNIIWDQAGNGILFNMRRDIRYRSLPRLGQPCHLACRATNTLGSGATLVAVGMSLARLPVPVELPFWGKLFLDPATAVVHDVLIVPDADTPAETTLLVPATPALLGTSITTQGLFLPIDDPLGAHLSSALTEAILP